MKVDYKGSKVLIVDDNPANVDILLELLSDYDVRVVLDGRSALDAVSEELPDLILLDITMPGMSGFEVCEKLKASSRTKEVPVIFLSASDDDASILHGFDIGGVDYITKPYRSKEVLARVKTHLQLFHALRKLEKIATTDDLTGIPNRRKFFIRAAHLMEQAKARNIPLYLFLIELDNAKEINDTYGHSVGVRFVQGFADAAKEVLPPKSCFARLEGDEFAIMLSGNRDKALKKIEMLRAMVEKIRPIRGKQFSVSISVGMTQLKPDDAEIQSLLKRADLAVHDAKEQGGNRLVINA